MLSHGNLLASSSAASEAGILFNEESTHISYLPLAHSFEKSLWAMGISFGASAGFYSGDPLKLLDDMQALQPTVFVSVPRLYNRIYDKIMAGVKEASTMK